MKRVCYLNVDGELSSECSHQIPDNELVRGYEIMLLTDKSMIA